MKRKIKEELVKLATDIITSRDMNEISEMYEAAQIMYEKLAVLKFIDEKLTDIEIDVSKNVIAAKFEKMANQVLSANSGVPESNPHQEDIIAHQGMDTIKNMVSHMPAESNSDDVLNEFLGSPDLMKNDKDFFMPPEETGVKKETVTKSLNDKPQGKEIKVDLNNRLAFVKHLFNGSGEDYNRVLSQLGTINTEKSAIEFINNLVKPDYNNWAGKEEYVERFMDLIERRFA